MEHDITALVIRLLDYQDHGGDATVEQLCREHPDDADEITTCYHRMLELRHGVRAWSPPPEEGTSPLDSNPAVERLRSRQHPYERYSSEQEIGRGGMGVVSCVYDEDLDRELAVKRVRADQVSARTLERFFDEARVTAQLDHPGIVPVYELGLDSRGDAYFSMQLVRGRDFASIVATLRSGDADWTMVRVLNTLLRACEAVAYAHEKGVIHRDLKPANIMVGTHGQVYVVDWGLARTRFAGSARDIRVQEASSEEAGSLRTRDGDVIGTLVYMPPEQAHGQIDEMGPWSDVYSIGAILYELLTGRLPYHGVDEAPNAKEVLHRLRSGPPVFVGELAHGQPPELVAICAQAMSRDAEARYSYAGELAADLRAYLEGRVVSAHRTGLWVELCKWAARNKALAIVSAVAIVTLVAGVAVSTLFAIEASRNDRRGKAALSQFVTLGFVDPAHSEDAATMTLADAIQLSIASQSRFDPEFPGVEGMIRQARGSALSRVGKLDLALEELSRALPLQRRALGRSHSDYHELLNWLAEVHLERHELNEAERFIREALQLCPDVSPEQESERTLQTKYLDVWLAMDRDEPGVLERTKQLLEVAQQAVSADHPGIILGMIEIGMTILHNAKNIPMAKAVLVPALERSRSVLGEDHPYTLYAMREVCYMLMWDGNVAESPEEKKRLYEESFAGHQRHLALCEKRLGPTHPDTILSLRDVGDMHALLGRNEEAERSLAEALRRIDRTTYGRNLKFLLVRRSYAELLLATGRTVEAKDRLLAVYTELNDLVGWSNLSTITAIEGLVEAYEALGDKGEVTKWKQQHERARVEYNSRVR